MTDSKTAIRSPKVVETLPFDSTASSSSNAVVLIAPTPPVFKKGDTAETRRRLRDHYRSEKAAHLQAVAAAHRAAEIEAARKRKAETEVVVVRAPKRSELIKQGLISKPGRKGRARAAAPTVTPKSHAESLTKQKATTKVKQLSPLQAATNPTRARLTGPEAAAVARKKKLWRAARKAANKKRELAKRGVMDKEARRTQMYKDANELAPEPTHRRFPVPGDRHSHRAWADDEDVQESDKAAWCRKHGFTITKDWGHTIECSLSGFHFWAEEREDVIDATPDLDASRWSMVKGVFTYHGRLPGGAPVSRKPPSFSSTALMVSAQLVTYVNLCRRPISAQSVVSDGLVRWLVQCPDTLLLCTYGPNENGLEDHLRTRMLASLRGTRTAGATSQTIPSDHGDHTPTEVALWAKKTPPVPAGRLVDHPDDDHPIRFTVVVGTDINVGWASTLEDVIEVVESIRNGGTPVTLTLETPSHAIAIMAPRLLGGNERWFLPRPRLLSPDEAFDLMMQGHQLTQVYLVTPYETRPVFFESEIEADNYGRMLSQDHDVVVSIHPTGTLVYTILGRLLGGGKEKFNPENKRQTRGKGSRKHRMQQEAQESAERTADVSGSSSSSEHEVRPGKFKRQSNWDDEMEDEEDENLTWQSAKDFVKTTGAEAKQSLVEMIKERVISVKAHREGEPDWNAALNAWDLKFLHLGLQWYFDSRVTEQVRIDLIIHTESLTREAGIALFDQYFKIKADQHIDDQIAFGWGARNYREFGPLAGKFEILTKAELPRSPTVREYGSLYSSTLDLSDTDQRAQVCRIITGKATWQDLQDINAWILGNAKVSNTDFCAMRVRHNVGLALVDACKKAGEGNPFVPVAPAEPVEVYPDCEQPADRYATLIIPAPLPLNPRAPYLRNFGVKLHLTIRQFVNAYIDDLSEGYGKVSELVDNFIANRRLRSLAKFGAGVALMGVPVLTAVASLAYRRKTFEDLKPLAGLRLYNSKLRAEIIADCKSTISAFDPTTAQVVLSEDQPWVDDVEDGDYTPTAHFEEKLSCVATQGPLNPLFRLAAQLTASCRRQIAPEEEPDPLKPDSVDVRAQKSRVEKMLVRDCTVSAFATAAISTTITTHGSLLVCKELFGHVIGNYKRYSALVQGPNPYQNLSSAVLTAVMTASANYNIPITTADRPQIEHDTARAAAIAIWSLIARDTAGQVPGPEAPFLA